MERTCIFSGSFDPVTAGHVDIIRRASALFDRVIVAVLHNPAKTGCFSVEERLDMIRRACAGLPQVEARAFAGMLVDAVEATGAVAVVRGLRSVADYESERAMAQFNSELRPGTETVFLMTRPEQAHISSSTVKELASLGADFSAYVPQCNVETIRSRFNQ
ncbi:MAG: pantetheine-phosphate adenylyltransferase [Clostridiales bacterium]|nr:pantetheine-phosphate adenylyltransferase [Clostridiales bacterium]